MKRSEEYRLAMVEAIAETDEELMLYLEGEELTEEQLKAALRKLLSMYKSFLYFAVLAYKNKSSKDY